jgi:hypothetical protein
MISWPKPQKRFPRMGEQFHYGALCHCSETGEKTGIRVACYVRPPNSNPSLKASEISWILTSLSSRMLSKSKSRFAIHCLHCPVKQTSDVWFMRLEEDLGGPWCSDCLDSKVRQELGLDEEVDEGIPLYLVHFNQKFLTTLSAFQPPQKESAPAKDIDPRTLF